jgi:hypothetical protein
VRGFATFDDRIVLATGGVEATTVWILDDKGKLLTSHLCHGGLVSPGDAQLVQMGDSVVVSNFIKEPAGSGARVRGTAARRAAVA